MLACFLPLAFRGFPKQGMFHVDIPPLYLLSDDPAAMWHLDHEADDTILARVPGLWSYVVEISRCLRMTVFIAY